MIVNSTDNNASASCNTSTACCYDYSNFYHTGYCNCNCCNESKLVKLLKATEGMLSGADNETIAEKFNEVVRVLEFEDDE